MKNLFYHLGNMVMLAFSLCIADDTIVAVGDIALGVYGTPMNIDTILNPVKPYLHGKVVFGNLEGVLLNSNAESTKQDKKNYYSFKIQESDAKLLRDAGFTILNFNNNHANDFGLIGKENTKKVLNFIGIKCLIDTLTTDSITFLSFYLHSNHCIEWTDSIEQMIRNAKKSKYLIVSIHGGQEGSIIIKDTCEKFLGEYRGNLYEFSHKSIDAGANLVLCHGPHVLRNIEIYKHRLIAHSLGNFCTPFGFKLDGKYGETEVLKIILDTNGNLKHYQEMKFKQIRNIGYISY